MNYTDKEKYKNVYLTLCQLGVAFLVGKDRIAEKLNQQVIFASFHEAKRGKYKIAFIPLKYNPNQSEGFGIIDEYANFIENTLFKSLNSGYGVIDVGN